MAKPKKKTGKLRPVHRVKQDGPVIMSGKAKQDNEPSTIERSGYVPLEGPKSRQ